MMHIGGNTTPINEKIIIRESLPLLIWFIIIQSFIINFLFIVIRVSKNLSQISLFLLKSNTPIHLWGMPSAMTTESSLLVVNWLISLHLLIIILTLLGILYQGLVVWITRTIRSFLIIQLLNCSLIPCLLNFITKLLHTCIINRSLELKFLCSFKYLLTLKSKFLLFHFHVLLLQNFQCKVLLHKLWKFDIFSTIFRLPFIVQSTQG